MLRATEWVEDGRNEITFDGDHTEPFYAKVVTMRQQHLNKGVSASLPVVRTVSKRMVEPKMHAEPLEFRIDKLQMRNDAFDRMPVNRNERMTAETEIRNMLIQFYDALTARDADNVVHFFIRRRLRPETKWLVSSEAETAFTNQFRNIVSDESFSAVGEPKDLKWVWGSHNVILYTAVENDESSPWGLGAYSYRMRSDTIRQRQEGPIMLVRVKGEWLYWY
jgi:hypothetical protein